MIIRHTGQVLLYVWLFHDAALQDLGLYLPSSLLRITLGSTQKNKKKNLENQTNVSRDMKCSVRGSFLFYYSVCGMSFYNNEYIHTSEISEMAKIETKKLSWNSEFCCWYTYIYVYVYIHISIKKYKKNDNENNLPQ